MTRHGVSDRSEAEPTLGRHARLRLCTTGVVLVVLAVLTLIA